MTSADTVAFARRLVWQRLEKNQDLYTLLAAAADTVFGWRRRLNSAAAGRAEKFLGFLDFFFGF